MMYLSSVFDTLINFNDNKRYNNGGYQNDKYILYNWN